MPRIRTIKPEFFSSVDIVELSPLARLLYIGLWCEADREGRMEWKPKTFKIRYLPVDDCDIKSICQELVDRKLVVLYGEGLAYIPKFTIHQHVNPREAKTTLPEPKNSTRQHASARVNIASARDSDTQVGRGRKGKERKEKEDASNLASSPPSLEEIKSYALTEFGLNGEFASNFLRVNVAKEWKDKTGKPYSNWKLVLNTWHKNLSPAEKESYRPHENPDNSMVHR